MPTTPQGATQKGEYIQSGSIIVVSVLLQGGVMKGECPCCHDELPEVLGLHWHSAAHWCTQSNTWLYTNGLLWSTDFREITLVPRNPPTKGTSGKDRQVPGTTVPFERPNRLQDQPSPA